MTEPADLWRLHQGARFPPSCLALAVEGVRLVKIDAVAGAILTASLRTDGVVRPLDDARRRDLIRYRALASKALQQPLDDEGRAYFERLLALAAYVLKE